MKYIKVDTTRKPAFEKVDTITTSTSGEGIAIESTNSLGFEWVGVGKDANNNGGCKYFKEPVEACDYISSVFEKI